MNRRIVCSALLGAALLAAPSAASAAVVVVPVPHVGSSDPSPAQIQRIAGYIGGMLRLVRSPSATSTTGPGVVTATIQFEGDRESPDSRLGVAVKSSGERAAFVIQAGHWVTLTDAQYAALTEHLVLQARIGWSCERTGSGFGGTKYSVVRRADPLVFGAPKGNLLPQGSDTGYVRLSIPPVAAGIPGPPAGCAHPAAQLDMTMTADLPENYPAGVPLGISSLPVRASTTLKLG